MPQIYRNNAFSVLASGVTNVATSMTLTDASAFPAPTGGDFALATLVGFGSNGAENAWEIVRITAKASNTLTVVRGQEGTTAVAWGAATQVQMRLTAASVDSKEELIASGSTSQFWRGDKTWVDFAATVRAAVLTGFSTASSAVVDATDSVLSALGKLQAQVSGKQATLVSGTNIKTINSVSLLGSGDYSITASSNMVRTLRTSNSILVAGDNGNLFDLFGAYTQTLTAAATLGAGWHVFLNNAGNIDQVIDANGSETIDGATTYTLKPGFSVILLCNGTSFTVLTIKRRHYTELTLVTASGSYTVPAGVYVLRCYAVGNGGTSSGSAGGGGGMAYGDIAVTPGQTVTWTISSGIAKVTVGGVDMLIGNPAVNDVAGTATKHASVTNGGAYSGGAGGAGSSGGGGSSGSPLGTGVAGASNSGGSGWGGAGAATSFSVTVHGGGGGGSGGAAVSSLGGFGGPSISSIAQSSEPLLALLNGAPGVGSLGQAAQGSAGGMGAGGGGGSPGTGAGGSAGYGGPGGFGGGGGGGGGAARAQGAGGFGGGGGGGTTSSAGGAGGYGGGAGGGSSTVSSAGAAILFFAGV